MPIPASYTETDLGTFIRTALGEVAGTLGWTTQTHVQEAINDALVLYDVSDIANATDIGKLRAFARVAGWRLAMASLAARFTFSTDAQSFQRSDMFKAASTALALAEADAAPFGLAGRTAIIGAITWDSDPYAAELPDAVEA